MAQACHFSESTFRIVSSNPMRLRLINSANCLGPNVVRSQSNVPSRAGACLSNYEIWHQALGSFICLLSTSSTSCFGRYKSSVGTATRPMDLDERTKPTFADDAAANRRHHWRYLCFCTVFKTLKCVNKISRINIRAGRNNANHLYPK